MGHPGLLTAQPGCAPRYSSGKAISGAIVERSRFDNAYIEYWSPWLDVVILARTLGASLFDRQGGKR